jgi:hypothetical protein
VPGFEARPDFEASAWARLERPGTALFQTHRHVRRDAKIGKDKVKQANDL